MNLGQIVESLLNKHSSAIGVILIAMTLIQISPIKLDPWSLLASCIGKAINKPVLEL